jgi:molybdopterin-containing oxidoreductase family iron-sulfur binding subunit
MPGQADNTVAVQLGYGRTRAGKVASELGYNAYLIRTSNAPWFDLGVEIRKVGENYQLATTQRQQNIEGRNIMRAGSLKEFTRTPNFVRDMDAEKRGSGSLYPEYRYDGYKWGMAINLSACIGCNACVVACQAENNIPVVGKNEVLRDRKMHWLRVDTYYAGTPAEPEAHFQPVPCMHCENAPCEVVCPVAATTHSSEGLNEMTYNRCIGTRYCSNNCPYKVRRFNFFQYADYDTPVLKLLNNPEVTVRSRGVMEKCTYCVQRINRARITAEREGRRIRDGDVLTACQAACPTEAIVFGDLNDPSSAVVKAKGSPLNYEMLGELNTRPRTTYLAELRNFNPEIRDE